MLFCKPQAVRGRAAQHWPLTGDHALFAGFSWALCRGGFVAMFDKGAANASLVVVIQRLLDARALQAPGRFPDARVDGADLQMRRTGSASESYQGKIRPGQ